MDAPSEAHRAMESFVTLPSREALFNPLLCAIRNLGGSASISELDDEVIGKLALTDEEIATPHKNGRRTELEYRLAWARTYLKAYGLLENSQRGIWTLAARGREVERVDAANVTRTVRARRSAIRDQGPETGSDEVVEARVEETWREELLRRLLDLPPDAFERLSQRILRESGFTQVTVTGRSGDGGIDGVGILQLGGLVSFRVLFQCKRYRGSVRPSDIRDFRGAMVGRAERGLFITTGAFTRDAKVEATRDGAPLIDLVDGELLLDKLKELGLGVRTRMIEEVSVVPAFFEEV